MIRLLRLRRLVQVAVLLLLAALPWLNRDGFTGMKGSLFAFDFFGLFMVLPFRVLVRTRTRHPRQTSPKTV